MFLDKLPTADMSWSVRTLLDFSFHPEINSAFEGGEQPREEEVTDSGPLCLTWLEDDGETENDSQRAGEGQTGRTQACRLERGLDNG